MGLHDPRAPPPELRAPPGPEGHRVDSAVASACPTTSHRGPGPTPRHTCPCPPQATWLLSPPSCSKNFIALHSLSCRPET